MSTFAKKMLFISREWMFKGQMAAKFGASNIVGSY